MRFRGLVIMFFSLLNGFVILRRSIVSMTGKRPLSYTPNDHTHVVSGLSRAPPQKRQSHQREPGGQGRGGGDF